MINFNWYINSLDCYKSKDGLENVIYNVRWFYIGVDEINNVSSTIDGITSLPEPNVNEFVDFNDIDKDTIVGWLTNILDVNGMETDITRTINDIIDSNNITIEFNQ
jgi:hypothetical protein